MLKYSLSVIHAQNLFLYVESLNLILLCTLDPWTAQSNAYVHVIHAYNVIMSKDFMSGLFAMHGIYAETEVFEKI